MYLYWVSWVFEQDFQEFSQECRDFSALQVAALLEGRMLELFDSLAKASPPSAYVGELLRRDFAGIKWDVQLMDCFSGKS